MKTLLMLVAVGAGLAMLAGRVASQTTQPAGAPAGDSERADREMQRLLDFGGPPAAKPLEPVASGPMADKTSGGAALAPGAPTTNVLREGSLIVDRTGWITRNADGRQLEFHFESDGKAMQDAPVILLPNLKLMAIEDELARTNRDLRFRITGMVTEYRGRNYVLLDKVVIVPEAQP
jgi:hypothetical protein